MGAIDAGGGLLGALAIGKAVGHGAPQVYKRRRKESETQAAEAARASVVYRPKLERVGGWQLLRQQNKMNADRLVEVLRRGIGAAMDKGMAYREFFHKLDADGSGEIEGRELRRGLRWLGIELGEREVNLILRRFSKDGRFLRYEDFLKFCEGEAREMDEIFDAVRSELKKLSGAERLTVDIVHATLDLEVDDGFATLAAVCARLDELGVHVSEERRGVLAKQFLE